MGLRGRGIGVRKYRGGIRIGKGSEVRVGEFLGEGGREGGEMEGWVWSGFGGRCIICLLFFRFGGCRE